MSVSIIVDNRKFAECVIVKMCKCKKIKLELAVLITNTVRTAVVINVMCVCECGVRSFRGMSGFLYMKIKLQMIKQNIC